MPSVYHLVLSNHSGSCTQHEQFCVIVFQKGRDGTFPSLPTSCLDTLQKNGKVSLMLKALVSHSHTVGRRGLKGIRHYLNAKFKPSPVCLVFLCMGLPSSAGLQHIWKIPLG